MTTFGWLLILTAVIIVRFAIAGRDVTTLPGDLGDLIIAAVQGRYDDVNEVLARTGASYEPASGAATGADAGRARGGTFGGAASASGSSAGMRVLNAAVKRGSGRRYVLGATGPDSYDCSGLVWQAMRDVGVYDGPRFTTHTWHAVARQIGAVKVDEPAVGDIAWWKGHMGVVDNPSARTYFSARSPKYGINSSSIDLTTRSRGATTVEFWRLP